MGLKVFGKYKQKARLQTSSTGKIKNWEPTNILEDGILPNFDCKGNFSATILRNANELGFEIRNWKWTKVFSWKGGFISIKNEIDDTKSYYRAIPLLRNKNLMYIDQLIDSKIHTLRNWRWIQMLQYIKKGPIPS